MRKDGLKEFSKYFSSSYHFELLYAVLWLELSFKVQEYNSNAQSITVFWTMPAMSSGAHTWGYELSRSGGESRRELWGNQNPSWGRDVHVFGTWSLSIFCRFELPRASLLKPESLGSRVLSFVKHYTLHILPKREGRAQLPHSIIKLSIFRYFTDSFRYHIIRQCLWV